jgi:hypothetical protein
MFKKLLIGTLLLSSTFASASISAKWNTEVFAEKSKYSFAAFVEASDNKFEYTCSVLKFNSSNFGKTESIILDLDLKLEEDKLNFQENYDVSFVFSNGKLYKHKLPLSSNREGKDRFTLFIDSKNDGTDNEIVSNLLKRSYINVEIADKSGKRVLYRFYLNNSFKSIKETQSNCNLLYKTFK